MKKTLALIIILFSNTILFGQQTFKTKPLIIRGRLTDCPEKYVRILIEDKDGQQLFDTIHLDVNGNFYLKTFKVKRPQKDKYSSE